MWNARMVVEDRVMWETQSIWLDGIFEWVERQAVNFSLCMIAHSGGRCFMKHQGRIALGLQRESLTCWSMVAFVDLLNTNSLTILVVQWWFMFLAHASACSNSIWPIELSCLLKFPLLFQLFCSYRSWYPIHCWKAACSEKKGTYPSDWKPFCLFDLVTKLAFYFPFFFRISLSLATCLLC